MPIIRVLSNVKVTIRASVTNRSAPFRRQFVASCIQRTAAFPCRNQLPECSTAKLFRFNIFLQTSTFCGLTWSSVKVLIVCFPEPSAYQWLPCYAQNGHTWCP